MNEIYLIEGLKNADDSAFRSIVNQYQVVIYNTCLGILGKKADAQDICQDVFVELYKSADKFRGDSKLSTWLYRIAVNKSLNHIRNNKKHRILRSFQGFFSEDENREMQIKDIAVNNPEEISEQSEHKIALRNAINALPENQKTAFVLKNYDDLSYKQITEIMNLSLSSVESLIHRARKNLQKSLQVYYDENMR